MSRADAGRLIHLSKKRERAKEDMEQQLKRMEEESTKSQLHLNGKGTSTIKVMFQEQPGFLRNLLQITMLSKKA